MLRKPITFVNLDGQTVTEEHYFHLTKAEIIKLEVSEEGGLQEKLKAVAASNNPKLILQTFEDILKASYGRRTDTGRFVKRQEDWEDFVSGEAYSTLFMELVTDGAYAAEFVRAILPADMDAQQVVQQINDVELPQPEVEEDSRPAYVKENREPTSRELQGMTKDELVAAMQRKMLTSGG